MENMDWLQHLQTREIARYVQELDLLHNVWFIIATIVFIAVSLFLKWRLLLSCTLSLAALIALATAVSNRGTSLEQSSDGLFMFIGGGAAVMFFLIYMVFMRGD